MLILHSFCDFSLPPPTPPPHTLHSFLQAFHHNSSGLITANAINSLHLGTIQWEWVIPFHDDLDLLVIQVRVQGRRSFFFSPIFFSLYWTCNVPHFFKLSCFYLTFMGRTPACVCSSKMCVWRELMQAAQLKPECPVITNALANVVWHIFFFLICIKQLKKKRMETFTKKLHIPKVSVNVKIPLFLKDSSVDSVQEKQRETCQCLHTHPTHNLDFHFLGVKMFLNVLLFLWSITLLTSCRTNTFHHHLQTQIEWLFLTTKASVRLLGQKSEW